MKRTVYLFILSLVLAACTPQSASNMLSVSTTIFPLYDITRQVAGDNLEVDLILPPGASPHTYEPTPQDIAQAADAAAIFAIGYGADEWVSSIAENAGVPEVIIVDRGIELMAGEAHQHHDELEADHPEDEDHHDSEEKAVDAHYWLSLSNAQVITQTIADELSRLDPQNQEDYQANAEAYVAQLQELRANALELQEQSNTQTIATFHNAWNYFARDVNLEVIATFEPFPGEQPSPQYVADFQAAIRDKNLQQVYIEPQLSSASLESLVEDLNVELVLLDPIGGGEERQSYLSLMEFNSNQVFNHTSF